MTQEHNIGIISPKHISASMKPLCDTSSNVTHNKDELLHNTHIRTSSRTEPPHIAPHHSPVIELILNLYRQKKQIEEITTQLAFSHNENTRLMKVLRSQLHDNLLKYHNDKKSNLLQQNDQITWQASKFRYFTRQKLKSRQSVIIAIQAYFKKKYFERKRNTRLSINCAILSHFREKDISALKRKVMMY